MMALVPRMLYFLEGLEAACLMAHVVFPAAVRPTIIRIYENRTKRGAVNSVYHGSLASPLAGDREGDSKPHSHLWEMEAVNSVYLTVLLLGVKQMRVLRLSAEGLLLP